MRILRPRRRLRTYATAFLLGAAVLLVAGWSALPVLVERRLLDELRAGGIAVASLNVTAVGPHETRIEDVRLGSNGDITAAEIIASYDFVHFLRAQPERLVLRGLRVSARLDSSGIAFGGLGLTNGNGEGGVVNAAMLQAVPMVAIDSGRIELVTPIGPLAVPLKGSVKPRSDGGVEAAIDLQAKSAHGRFGGALKLVAADGRIDADLTIVDGAAAIGQTLSTAFTGRTKVTWVEPRRPQVSVALELKETTVAGTAFPAGSLMIEVADAQWTAELALAQRDGSSDLQTKVVVSDPYENPRLSVAGNLTAAAGAWLWPVLGLPQPQRGSARVALRLDGPLSADGLLGRSIAMPGDVFGLLADGDIDGLADIAIGNIVFPDLASMDAATFRADIHASGGTLSIEHAVGTVSDLTMAGLNAASLEIDVDAAIAETGDGIAVRLIDDGVAVARGVSGTALAGKLKEVAVPIVQVEEPLITIGLNGHAAPRATYDLRLGAIKANAPLLLGGPKPMPVALALPGLRWAGIWSADGHEGTIQLADGSLAFPSLNLTAKGVRAAVAITGDTWSADLSVAGIVSSARPPLIAPLRLAGKADLIGDHLSFAGILSDGAKRLSATVDIEHSFAANKGQLKLKMRPLVFKPGGLQPHDLVPPISPRIEEVTGNAAIGGAIAWSGGKVVSDLELLLQDLSFKSPQADVVRLNSVVEIDSLVPFTTRPGQQLAAGMVDVGLPLSDLIAAFRIEPGSQLVIENARLSLTGGEVTIPTVAINLADPRAELALNVKDVDLARLLQLAQIEGLAGTGSLSGRIPVSIAGDVVIIHNAALAATGPGSLRYAPATTPSALAGGGENVDMALQALSNFQYSDLTLTMSREAGGDTVALMKVKGRNPDFYGGYPVEFNLNISGKLDQIVDRSLAGYRIPESIRKSLGDFGQ
jgi:hypothetical protein